MIVFIVATVFIMSSVAQVPSKTYIPQAQGAQGDYQASHTAAYSGAGGSGNTGNHRSQQEVEKNAATLKEDQVINEDGSYHFGYETSNGIRGEEQGNPAQAQGGFAYKGDDGQVYTITYTAGEGGFQPQGEHLPVAPPTPEAILEALRKNEQDEAAGIFDDGKYRPDQHNSGQNNQRQGYGSSGTQGGESHQGSFNANSGYQY